jgi:hypothetical protein
MCIAGITAEAIDTLSYVFKVCKQHHVAGFYLEAKSRKGDWK